MPVGRACLMERRMVTTFVVLALSLLVAPQAGTNPPPPPNPIPLGRPPDPPPHAAPPSTDLGTTHGGSGGSKRFSPPRTTNVQVNSASTADQDETALRVDLNDRLHLAAGSNDTRSGTYGTAFYASFDGGLTWSELYFPDPGGYGKSSDPAVAFGTANETYFEALAYNTGLYKSAIYVGRSDDGGLTVPNSNWIVAVKSNSGNFEDKP